MAEPGDQFRQSDVTFWGIVALAVGAFSVLAASLPAVVPTNVLTALHTPRLAGGNLNRLNAQVNGLRDETAAIRSENERLLSMFTLGEENRNLVTRRVGAIESTLPMILDSRVSSSALDRELITSGIGDAANQSVQEVTGGSVAVIQRPLEEGSSEPADSEMVFKDMPPVPDTRQKKAPRVIDTRRTGFGIALGDQVTLQDAFLVWKDIGNKAGPLLLGLEPLLSGGAGVQSQRLLAGPIETYAQAEQVCVRMIRIGINCLPVPYAGSALPE